MVTTRKKEKKLYTLFEHTNFQRLMNNMLEGCQVIDHHFRYIYLNEKAVEHAQKSRTDLIGKTMMESYPGIEKTEMFTHIERCMKERISCQMENLFTFPDGNKKWFELRIEPIDEGVFILSIDVTDRHLLEEARNDFLSMAAHQLRTPLSAMKWSLELFLKDTTLPLMHRIQVRDISFSNERLITLVNDLLSISRIEVGRLIAQCQPVSLAALISMSVSFLTARAKARRQTISIKTIPPNAMAHIDPILFTQAFENILDDAIEYANENSVITISVKDVANAYEISVHDYGMEILDHERQYIFTKFFRGLESRRAKPGNSGLGLYIAKSAVETNGGRIWFESSKKDGTTFFFTVPKVN